MSFFTRSDWLMFKRLMIGYWKGCEEKSTLIYAGSIISVYRITFWKDHMTAYIKI